MLYTEEAPGTSCYQESKTMGETLEASSGYTHMPGIQSSLDKSRIKTVAVVSLSSHNLNLAGSALHKHSLPVTGLLAN